MRGGDPEIVFYDGTCGLCHGFVRRVLAADPEGRFRFAPLDSDAFREAVPERERRALPDSVVVRTTDGRLLVRSDAALHVLERLDGGRRALARALRIVPRPVRDLVYRGVARLRRRLVRAPQGACPVVPPALRERFLD